jgi:serine/threonine protein phosphatase 1
MLGLRLRSKPKPKLPDGLRIYAVSDIHGCADLLQDVFAAIDHHLAHESIFLKGNHEAFLFEVLQDASRLEAWKEYGGFQTLMSYGLAPSIKPDRDEQNELVQALLHGMPNHHRRFFSHLRSSFSCGDFFFAHAGVKPGVPLRQQREEDLLWIRDEFLQSEEDFGKFVVHGHTPVSKPEIRPNRINIDTGAYATGILTLLTIQGERMFAI